MGKRAYDCSIELPEWRMVVLDAVRTHKQTTLGHSRAVDSGTIAQARGPRTRRGAGAMRGRVDEQRPGAGRPLRGY